MKKILLATVALIIVSFWGYSQERINFSGKSYEKKGAKWYDQNGHEVNTRVITIRLKTSEMKKYLPKYGRILRENSLGYIDIEVPIRADFFGLADSLNMNPYIEVVDINTIGKYNIVQTIPNDPLYSSQWYINQIQAINAWDNALGNNCILVGVLDSGVDWTHEDLGVGQDSYQNIWLNPGEDTWLNPNNPGTGNGIDDDSDGFIDNWKGWNYALNSNDVRTDNPHGTRVAGIVSAKTNNAQGIAGIGGGNNQNGVEILPICIGVNAPSSAVLDDAILQAVNKGVRVIQISASVGATTAINAAITHAVNNGVAVVCAAGNTSGSVSYPANNANTISVGATSQNDQKASFSNYGSNLTIAAPGVDILSTVLNNGYSDADGTSFAAPIVSGTIALMLSVNPSLTLQEVKDIITSTADKVGGYSYINGRSNELGYGRVNTYKAIQAVLPAITGPDFLYSGTEIYQTANVPSGAAVSWNSSSNIILSGSGNSRTASPVSGASGPAWIEVAITPPCGEATTRRKNIEIHNGAPTINGISYTYNFNTYPLQEYFTTANNEVCDLFTNVTARILIEGATQTNTEQIFATDPSAGWGENAGVPYDTRYVYFDFWGYNEINIFKITASNACGTTVYKFAFYSWDQCDNQYQTFPNPTSTNITVSTKKTSPVNKSNDKLVSFWDNLTIRRIKILNQSGLEVQEQEFGNNTNQVQIDVSALQDGIYYLIISDGKYSETQRVIVTN